MINEIRKKKGKGSDPFEIFTSYDFIRGGRMKISACSFVIKEKKQSVCRRWQGHEIRLRQRLYLETNFREQMSGGKKTA